MTESDEALESLYREQADRLWRAVYAYAGDRDLASDAVAEAFAQYLRRTAEIQSPAGWLWRAAFRIAAGELSDRRKTSPELEPFDSGVMSPVQDLLMTLRLLPPKQRAVLILHYYEGYTTPEIATILGSASATVRVHLSQGRKRLRKLLEEDG